MDRSTKCRRVKYHISLSLPSHGISWVSTAYLLYSYKCLYLKSESSNSVGGTFASNTNLRGICFHKWNHDRFDNLSSLSFIFLYFCFGFPKKNKSHQKKYFQAFMTLIDPELDESVVWCVLVEPVCAAQTFVVLLHRHKYLFSETFVHCFSCLKSVFRVRFQHCGICHSCGLAWWSALLKTERQRQPFLFCLYV